MTEGEDLGFVRKVSELGIKFYTDFSLACKHEKTIDLLDANNYAIQYSNRAVLEYDKRIKETIQPALQAAYDRGFKEGQKAAAQAAPKRPTLWMP
jgi:hypothetical protein